MAPAVSRKTVETGPILYVTSARMVTMWFNLLAKSFLCDTVRPTHSIVVRHVKMDTYWMQEHVLNQWRQWCQWIVSVSSMALVWLARQATPWSAGTASLHQYQHQWPYSQRNAWHTIPMAHVFHAWLAIPLWMASVKRLWSTQYSISWYWATTKQTQTARYTPWTALASNVQATTT